MGADPFYAPLGHVRSSGAAGESFTGSPAALDLLRHVFDHFEHRERVLVAEFLPRIVPSVGLPLRGEVERMLEHRLHHEIGRVQKTVLWVDRVRWYTILDFTVRAEEEGTAGWTEVPADFEHPEGFHPACALVAYVIPLFQPPQQKD